MHDMNTRLRFEDIDTTDDAVWHIASSSEADGENEWACTTYSATTTSLDVAANDESVVCISILSTHGFLQLKKY